MLSPSLGNTVESLTSCCAGKIAEYRPKASNKGLEALAEQTRICDGRVTGLNMPRSALFESVIDAQEYLSLASAADYHSDKAPSPQHQAAKLYVELDRLAHIAEAPNMNYRVRMGKLPKSARSPKDDVLWGWSASSCSETHDANLRSAWKTSQVAEALILGGFWLHDGVDEDTLPSEISLISPAADEASLHRAIQLVQGVAARRDRGVSSSEGCVAVTPASVASAGPPRTEGTCARLSNKEVRRLKFERAAADKALRVQQQPHQPLCPPVSNVPVREAACVSFVHRTSGFVGRNKSSGGGCWCQHLSCVFQTKQWPSLKALELHTASVHSGSKKVVEHRPSAKANVGTPNARGDRRLIQEAAHALCVSCFTPMSAFANAQMFIAPPAHWPLLLNRSLQMAGPLLEQIVAPWADSVPAASRRSLSSRRVQLGHRLVIVTEHELQQLLGHEVAEIERRHLLDSALAALGGVVDRLKPASEGASFSQETCIIESRHLSGEMCVTTVPHVTGEVEVSDVNSDLNVSGAVRKQQLAVVFSLALCWPEASAWRQGLGLSSSPNCEGTFVVELGM